MKLSFRNAFWAGATILLALLLLLAFRPTPVTIDVGQTWRGPMQVTVRDEGRTRVRDEYIVYAPVSGQLERVRLKPGAEVAAGDVVARIHPGAPAFLDARQRAEAQAAVRAAEAALSAATAELERAEAAARFARTELERVERLRERHLASAEALDQARLQLRTAEAARATAAESVRMREAELEAARVRLTRPQDANGEPVNVLTPVSGRLLRVTRESAGVIAAGEEILSVGDPDDLEIVVEMLTTDAVLVEPGAEVIIEDWSRLREPLAGRVRLIEPYGFRKISALGVEEQRVNVIVDFTGPPGEWRMLGHGYRVEAAIVIWKADDVVQVPVPALFRDQGEWALFRIESGRARKTPVEIGRDNGQSAEVLSGIGPGVPVVLYPGEEIEDGTRVEPRP
ncbi:MAG TPA: HlyD family efflux transporter periplasmic adaptor subunit [Woeseiaceae bacterium]|nr:HlyD family efflux transporter periplasmic adaptor subunit [Woeseiaceae bacterium]